MNGLIFQERRRTKRSEQLIYSMYRLVRDKTKAGDSLLGDCHAKIMCNDCGVARKFVHFETKGKYVGQEACFCGRG